MTDHTERAMGDDRNGATWRSTAMGESITSQQVEEIARYVATRVLNNYMRGNSRDVIEHAVTNAVGMFARASSPIGVRTCRWNNDDLSSSTGKPCIERGCEEPAETLWSLLTELADEIADYGRAVESDAASYHAGYPATTAKAALIAVNTRLAMLARLTAAQPSDACEDTRRLRWVLRNASLTMLEDGDCVGLFLRSDERAFAIVAECTGEDGLTEDDAPWLTPEQRASINGLPPSPTGSVTDPTAIRQAIDAAMSSSTDTKEGA